MCHNITSSWMNCITFRYCLLVILFVLFVMYKSNVERTTHRQYMFCGNMFLFLLMNYYLFLYCSPAYNTV